MAGEVIQTPTQAAAPPFQVINPSGISGSESLNTLTQVGEGNRNRAAQQQMQQQQMQMQQQQLAAQQQEAAADRALQERQLKDQEFHRQRSEKMSTIYSDGQMEIDKINEEIQEALRSDRDEDVQALVARKRGIEGERAKLGDKLNGLEMLKAAHGGLLSTAIGADGKSAGAAMVRGMLNKAAGAQTIYDSAQKRLVPIIDRINAEDEAKAQTPSIPQTGGEVEHPWMSAEWSEARARKRIAAEGGTPEEQAKKLEKFLNPGTQGGDPFGVTQMFGGMDKKAEAVPADPNKKFVRPPSELATNQRKSGRWQELVENLAIHAHGQADPEVVKAKLGNLFDSLEAAVRPGSTPAEQGAHKQNARDAYVAAKKAGMDAETLDKLLYMVQAKTGAASVAPVVENMDKMEKGAQGQQPVKGQTKAGKKLSMLGRMLTTLESMTEEVDDGAGNKVNKQMMRSYGDSPFFDFSTGQAKPVVESLIMNTITTLAGMSRPEDVIADSDPNNDPEQFKFLKEIHPEVREIVLKELGYQAQDIRNVRKNKGVTGDVGELEGVADASKEITRQWELAQQDVDRMETGVRGSKKQKQIMDEGMKKRNKATEELKRKRDAVKSGPDYLLE